jgi:hypothetical protein
MWMSIRLFTQLTNGLSKKLDNQKHALALYFMNYNFGRVHQTLRVTLAREAGVSDHFWTIQASRRSMRTASMVLPCRPDFSRL